MKTGYYDPELDPCVCPVCGKVLSHGPDRKAVVRHLTRCLDGRVYKVQPGGRITVLDRDEEAGELCGHSVAHFDTNFMGVWIRMERKSKTTQI